jgi:type II secretory pathway component PulF
MRTPLGGHVDSIRPAGRAAFFYTLARYCQAGMTLDRGLYQWAEQLPPHDRSSFEATAQRLQSGQTFAHAGLKSGILQPWEARLLAAGTVHGRLDRILDELADYHEQATDWWQRLRMRLLFPGGILLLGFLTLPLPELVAGQNSVSTYLLQNLLLVVTLVAVWGVLRPGWRQPWLTELILRCHSISKPVWQYQRHRFLRQLATLYNAGISILDALPIAVESCDSTLLRRQWSMIEAAIREGSGVSEALHRHGAVDDTGYALLICAEASGRLGEILDHETRRLGQLITLWRESLVEWLPRLAYVLVMLLLFSL